MFENSSKYLNERRNTNLRLSSNLQEPWNQVPWRLLNTGPAPGHFNMALDLAILEAHSEGLTPPTLRFYTWQPPAVSLGRFQDANQVIDLDQCKNLGIGWVNRPTGGRAVLHWMDLTYSVIISHEMLPGSVLETYRIIASGLLEGLKILGIDATMFKRPPKHNASKAPLACFDTTSWYEIQVGGRKLIGSAQSRKKGVILQHGSIPIEPVAELLATVIKGDQAYKTALTTRLNSHATCLNQAGKRKFTYQEVAEGITEGFKRALGIVFEPGKVTEDESIRAKKQLQPL